ncbi:tetratricopeptide repeat protein [Simiduia aestuariiviva]|uniref:Tetratricopeptide (TPR) repeat protein n=1 Tax=Simiduia aestuariiviva TaxID=1510459 RepID=A0A839UQR2_9GAMM|nr:hypothetical protein [Simiduia aestuariiviva]MBB3168186.1 tetratricopeptide (TPR) repeat protein [Simiduia aestuariiviva]
MSETPTERPTDLPSALLEHIKSLCATGYQHYDQHAYEPALRTFYQAWVLLPKPQTQYHAAGWVLTALGDCYFQMEKWPQALEAISSALFCPNAEKNLFALMRKGQILYKQGDIAAARVALFKVYSSGGQSLLAKEPDLYLRAIADLTGSA